MVNNGGRSGTVESETGSIFAFDTAGMEMTQGREEDGFAPDNAAWWTDCVKRDNSPISSACDWENENDKKTTR